MMDRLLGLISDYGLALVTGFITGIFVSVISNSFQGSKREITSNEESKVKTEYSFPEGSGETKMVLVVRNDLKMGKGKAAAQCSHGAVMANEIAARRAPKIWKDWKENGQRKIVVKTDTEGELLQLASEAKKVGLVCAIVRDAGLTQIQSGSLTVLAVGPGPQNLIDKVTSHLKLY